MKPTGSIQRTRGLTLIELMVVVAIMVIIATIAYPLYTEQTRKSRRAEGRSALLELAQQQERFFTVNSRYAVTLSSLSVDATTEHGYYTITTTGGGTFLGTATAAGAQASDATCTSMTINQLGVKSGTGADVDKCW